jgi:hypothetical protein
MRRNCAGHFDIARELRGAEVGAAFRTNPARWWGATHARQGRARNGPRVRGPARTGVPERVKVELQRPVPVHGSGRASDGRMAALDKLLALCTGLAPPPFAWSGPRKGAAGALSRLPRCGSELVVARHLPRCRYSRIAALAVRPLRVLLPGVSSTRDSCATGPAARLGARA